MDFFIQLLYRLLIPWMRIPPFLEKTETRYFISELSCQSRLNGEAKPVGDNTPTEWIVLGACRTG